MAGGMHDDTLLLYSIASVGTAIGILFGTILLSQIDAETVAVKFRLLNPIAILKLIKEFLEVLRSLYVKPPLDVEVDFKGKKEFGIGKARDEIGVIWEREENKAGRFHPEEAKAVVSKLREEKDKRVRGNKTPQLYDVVKKKRWHFIDRELSSNVAGEIGAVNLYKGTKFAIHARNSIFGCPISRESTVTAFAEEHLDAEIYHLYLMLELIPTSEQREMYTRVIFISKVGGFLLGFLPTFFGGGVALYHTVEMVESFVEEHYQHQISWLRENFQKGKTGDDDNKSQKKAVTVVKESELSNILAHCCEDEVHHCEQAKEQLLGLHPKGTVEYGICAWVWRSIVDIGGRIAAGTAKRI